MLDFAFDSHWIIVLHFIERAHPSNAAPKSLMSVFMLADSAFRRAGFDENWDLCVLPFVTSDPVN